MFDMDDGRIRVQLGGLDVDVDVEMEGSIISEASDILSSNSDEDSFSEPVHELPPMTVEDFIFFGNSFKDEELKRENRIEEPLLLAQNEEKRLMGKCACPSIFSRLRDRPNSIYRKRRQYRQTALLDNGGGEAPGVYVLPYLPVKSTTRNQKAPEQQQPSVASKTPTIRTTKASNAPMAPVSLTSEKSMELNIRSDGDTQTTARLGNRLAYDMSTCSEIVSDDFDDTEEQRDDEPLIQKKDAFLNCFRRSPRKSSPTSHAHFVQKDTYISRSAFGAQYKGIHQEQGVMLGTVVTQQDTSLPSQYTSKNKSGEPGHGLSQTAKSMLQSLRSHSTIRRDELRRARPTALSYDDLQARFHSEIELHEELDEMVQCAVDESPVDTLRAPLDLQLSTLYEEEQEDEEEEEDILSSITSQSDTTQENTESKTQKLAEYLRRDGEASFDYYEASMGSLLSASEAHERIGANPMDSEWDSPYHEASTSCRRKMMELVANTDYKEGIQCSEERQQQTTTRPDHAISEKSEPREAAHNDGCIAIAINTADDYNLIRVYRDNAQNPQKKKHCGGPVHLPTRPITNNWPSLHVDYDSGDEIVLRSATDEMSELTSDVGETGASSDSALAVSLGVYEGTPSNTPRSGEQPAAQEDRDDSVRKESRREQNMHVWTSLSNPSSSSVHVSESLQRSGDDNRDGVDDDEGFWYDHYMESDTVGNQALRGHLSEEDKVRSRTSMTKNNNYTSKAKKNYTMTSEDEDDPYAGLHCVTRIAI